MFEKHIEMHLVSRTRALGGIAYKFTSPARRSVPDRIVVLPQGRIIFVECKRPRSKATPAQAREHARLRALGCNVQVVDSKEGVDALLREGRT